MPAARLVRQEHNAGTGDTIEDNTDTISTTIDEHNQTVSLDPGEAGGDTGPGGVDGGDNDGPIDNGGQSADGGDDGGCQVVGLGAPAGGGLFVMFLLGLGFVRRRR
jgi:hypothetical protein